MNKKYKNEKDDLKNLVSVDSVVKVVYKKYLCGSKA